MLFGEFDFLSKVVTDRVFSLGKFEDEATDSAVGLFGGYMVDFGHGWPSRQLLGDSLQDTASVMPMRTMGMMLGMSGRESPRQAAATGAAARLASHVLPNRFFGETIRTRARTCTQEYAAAAKLNRKNHLRAHRKDPDWEAAVPAREFAPVTA